MAVVDADRSVLRSLESLVQSANCAVRHFVSGAALLDSGCLPGIDCLLLGIDMPGGDDLLTRIHAVHPGLPTILVTGDPDGLKPLPPLGGIYPGLFTRPCEAAELLAAVSDVLRYR